MLFAFVLFLFQKWFFVLFIVIGYGFSLLSLQCEKKILFLLMKIKFHLKTNKILNLNIFLLNFHFISLVWFVIHIFLKILKNSTSIRTISVIIDIVFGYFVCFLFLLPSISRQHVTFNVWIWTNVILYTDPAAIANMRYVMLLLWHGWDNRTVWVWVYVLYMHYLLPLFLSLSFVF